jgi:hypothetical protein
MQPGADTAIDRPPLARRGDGALGLLRADGLIESVGGYGTFVRKD